MARRFWRAVALLSIGLRSRPSVGMPAAGFPGQMGEGSRLDVVRRRNIRARQRIRPQGRPRNWRATAWEIHPVTWIEVVPMPR